MTHFFNFCDIFFREMLKNLSAGNQFLYLTETTTLNWRPCRFSNRNIYWTCIRKYFIGWILWWHLHSLLRPVVQSNANCNANVATMPVKPGEVESISGGKKTWKGKGGIQKEGKWRQINIEIIFARKEYGKELIFKNNVMSL